MNRLTEKDKQGNWSLKGVKWEQLHEGATITGELWKKLYGALWKLMEYEDTGLDPDDAIRLDNFNQCSAGKVMKKLAEEKAKHRWIRPGDGGDRRCAGAVSVGSEPVHQRGRAGRRAI